MSEFKAYHPLVNFVYFVFVIGFSMFFMNPLCLGISLVCAFIYSVILKGRKAIRKNLIYMLPMLVFMALINPAFNHEGLTIITYLPDGNPLTLESVFYGIGAAVMLMSVICWFSCYNEVMTSDKFICLFGRIIPSLSLILSMTLRFVPLFLSRLKVVANARRGIGRNVTDGSVVKRAKNGLDILSVMTTWSLENAITTADSMKSRGYGASGRTSFSVFSFDRRDFTALLYIVILGMYIFIGNICGGMYFRYFPSVKASECSPYAVSLFFSYFLLCIYPVIIEIREVIRWNALKSKI